MNDKKKKQNGFVLFTVLIYMQIISQVIIHGLLSLALLTRETKTEWQRIENIVYAKRILLNLENKIGHQKTCHYAIFSDALQAMQSESWWKRYGCSGNFTGISYYYVTEQLKEVDCVMTRPSSSTLHKVRYYRITLFMPFIKSYQGRILLQSVVAIPYQTISNCSSIYAITVGHQAWREL